MFYDLFKDNYNVASIECESLIDWNNFKHSSFMYTSVCLDIEIDNNCSKGCSKEPILNVMSRKHTWYNTQYLAVWSSANYLVEQEMYLLLKHN